LSVDGVVPPAGSTVTQLSAAADVKSSGLPLEDSATLCSAEAEPFAVAWNVRDCGLAEIRGFGGSDWIVMKTLSGDLVHRQICPSQSAKAAVP
jgi:hypothetical protein